MKKIKIMLTAITVMAVVGGALAFKAVKFTKKNVFCKDFAPQGTCLLTDYQTTLRLVGASTKPCVDGSGIRTTAWYTTTADNCTLFTIDGSTNTVYATIDN